MSLEPIEVQHSEDLDPNEQAAIESAVRELFAEQFGDQLGIEPDDVEVRFSLANIGPKQLRIYAILPANLDLGIGEVMYGESLNTIYMELVKRFPGRVVIMSAESG
ncbi:MAG TPA: hypothetical protein VFT49_02345 [Candidatus Saccharimonadales bacterium]|nr:hypothetical protein [Candidatus Saccharimonadales bacterium]